ncbi:MAG: Ig-like domain-containing protein [Eubacteriales bacterium]|nr:Ig-like domain-containing protein [Eubacteriales bacterium]
MIRTRIAALLGACLCVLALAGPAEAAQVEAGSVYCFSQADFGQALRGICLTDIPGAGQLLLEGRVLRAGDVLTADQAARMTFCARPGREDAAVQVGYLPIDGAGVGSPAAMTIGIRGRDDKPPVAEDSTAETYKNLPNTGKLKATDPEGQTLTFTVTRQPRRGTVTVGDDGTFTYTPKKNKVGVDSFAYTAADPAGQVSREATVTVTILKPTDAAQYTDTAGESCRFAAEWMRHTGIFTGETIGESPCFGPEKPVSRGEFVTMLVKALDIPTDADLVYTGYDDPIPTWLQPYLAAAIRAGLTAGLPQTETFGPEEPITGAEAAVLLQNALDLPAPALSEEPPTPQALLAAQGLTLDPETPLTRAETALALYQAKKLTEA